MAAPDTIIRVEELLAGSREGERGQPGSESVLTVTRAEILVDGSDAQFRELINNLLLMSKQLQELRAKLAEQFGLTEPQYRVFMAVAHHDADGVSVGTVAGMLRVSGAFVTAETGKLMQKGLVLKREDPADRRSVLISLSEEGRSMVACFSGRPQAINNELFHGFTSAEFRFFCEIVQRLVENAERAALRAQGMAATDDDKGFARRLLAGASGANR